MNLERACSGARQDIFFEGACAAYWNRMYYIKFLQEQIHHKDKQENKMAQSLYTLLCSKEMVERTWTDAILHLLVCMPHCFLSGKCDQLSTP